MATFNCGTTKKQFSAIGRAVGLTKDIGDITSDAVQTADAICREKCNNWISSKSCRDRCRRKTSQIKFVSGSVSIVPSGPGKIRVTHKLKLRAIVNCKN